MLAQANAEVSTPEDEQSFWGKVEDFKNQAAEFARVFSRMRELRYIAEQDASASIRYADLMGLGNTIMDKVQYVTGLIDSVYGWVGNFFGVETRDEYLNDIGAVPLIPIAVIVGASAFIVTWLSKAYVQLRELEAVERLLNEGYTAEEAYKLARGEQGGIMGTISNVLMMALVIGAGIYFMRKG